MADIFADPKLNLQVTNKNRNIVVTEEIPGLLKVYKDGQVERLPTIPIVPSSYLSDAKIMTKDTFIDKYMNLLARVYVPNTSSYKNTKLPLVIYFHGGGFCIGSAAWSCYHEFVANVACKARCVIISLNYRLAPENRLPAAYEDGMKTLMWVKQQASKNGSSDQKWWLNHTDFSSTFLAGDSAGANIAYHVATRLNSSSSNNNIRPLCLKGIILIQPFFGGEARTSSEKHSLQPANSALPLSVSDTYWRLSLPLGANKDHPWCNPLANGLKKLKELRLPPMMVCVSEMDILKDRNLEFCNAMAAAGKRVDKVVYKGVGHAFQILYNSQFSNDRVQEMMSHLRAFIHQ